jgi:hypothetical protein
MVNSWSRSMAWLPALLLWTCAAAGAGCGSSSPARGGGPVAGPVDTHCADMSQPVSAASCLTPPADGGMAAEFGETLYNAEGDDDDCKYHLKFSATPSGVKANQTITFTVTLTYKDGGAPATGAVNAAGDGIYIEGYLAATAGTPHVLPNPAPVFSETRAGSGIYTATATFDVAGLWVVRFHLFGNCLDGAEDSPHGHVAFFFDVL